jgi:hypothetical protein
MSLGFAVSGGVKMGNLAEIDFFLGWVVAKL